VARGILGKVSVWPIFLWKEERSCSVAEIKYDETFLDEKTGETVHRVNTNPKWSEELEKHLNNNGAAANAFLILSRQIMDLQNKQKEQFDKANAAEMGVAKEVVKLRDRMGLDSAWVYNIALKKMEKREPPPDTKILPEPVK
jgi:hypothetical protein